MNQKPDAGFDKLRQRPRQAAFSSAASSLAELVEASKDAAPPTVLT